MFHKIGIPSYWLKIKQMNLYSDFMGIPFINLLKRLFIKKKTKKKRSLIKNEMMEPSV